MKTYFVTLENTIAIGEDELDNPDMIRTIALSKFKELLERELHTNIRDVILNIETEE